MKYKLFKLSEPGWELEFDSLQEAGDKLLKHICSDCSDEAIGSYTCFNDKLIYDLLCTACGCEFDLEEV